MQIKLTTEELTKILINAEVISPKYNVVAITRSAGTIPTLIIYLEVVQDERKKEI